jgi:NADPH-dependent ferric siderophore reductase
MLFPTRNLHTQKAGSEPPLNTAQPLRAEKLGKRAFRTLFLIRFSASGRRSLRRSRRHSRRFEPARIRFQMYWRRQTN